jgi:hypothetical protein
VRLVGICAALWVVAGAILWSNWPDTKRDYYWGNIMQGLEGQPQHLDQESITALAAMGDGVIPSCSYEIVHHWNPAFRIAVTKVLEQTNGKGASDILAAAAVHDATPQVRANALLALKARTKTNPAEMAPLLKLCEEVAMGKTNGDPVPEVRSTAALILAEDGNGSNEVKRLLVYGLRLPFIRKDMATALAKVSPDAPSFKCDAPDLELRSAIIADEKWLEDQGIALVASGLTMPVTSQTGGDGK